ncbi:MAG: HupE/UreJ family protein [Opitutaceae bacterium]|nr:HupE/UreJ family protein [Opitutaceae bacterium]
MKYVLVLFAALAAVSTAFAHGMSEADQATAMVGGNLEYIKLGALHMLTGYDHLLFLFGVMFFLTNVKDILKFITAFTLGHCITLIAATLLEIQANYFLIDAVIALTVCYKAFDNLDGFKKYIGIASPNLLYVVFGFGLIHGFGLSARLQQLPLGHDGLVLKILSFNVGVELGQIGALVVMGFILSQWRHTSSFSKFSKASNIALLCSGIFLKGMQLVGFQQARHAEASKTVPTIEKVPDHSPHEHEHGHEHGHSH